MHFNIRYATTGGNEVYKLIIPPSQLVEVDHKTSQIANHVFIVERVLPTMLIFKQIADL